MAAGENTLAKSGQLEDDLLEDVIVCQIEAPAADDQIYLIPVAEWQFTVESVYARTVSGGDLTIQLTIDDVAPGIQFEEANTEASISTDGTDMQVTDGGFSHYTATGGVETDESDSNVVAAGSTLKLHVVDLLDTAPQDLIVQVLIRRIRGVPA